MARVAVLDADQSRVGLDAVAAGQQPVGVGDLVRLALVAGEARLGGGAVAREIRVLQSGPPEHREVVGRGHLAVGVVPVGGDHMGVQCAQGTGLGLHLTDRGLHSAVECGQHMDGVVAGVQEHPPPQVADPVGVALLHPDEAAAGTDVRQFPRGDGVPGFGGQSRQHGEGEQCLEGAGGRQRAVRVVRGQHLPGARVGDQPRQRRRLGEFGHPRALSYLRSRRVQEGGSGSRGPWDVGVGARDGDGGMGREGRRPGHAESAAGEDDAGRESYGHTRHLGAVLVAAPGQLAPSGGIGHPDA